MGVNTKALVEALEAVNEAHRRLKARNMQLVTAMSAIRDITEGADTVGNNSDRLRQIKQVCDEQIARGWADAE